MSHERKHPFEVEAKEALVNVGLSFLAEHREHGKGPVSFTKGAGILGVEASSPGAKNLEKALLAFPGKGDWAPAKGDFPRGIISLNDVIDEVLLRGMSLGYRHVIAKGGGKNSGRIQMRLTAIVEKKVK
jgi:hypothetical protein